MCTKIKCALQYTVDLINNNINRDVQEECANRLYWVYTPGIGCILIGKLITYCVAGKNILDLGTDRKEKYFRVLPQDHSSTCAKSLY